MRAARIGQHLFPIRTVLERELSLDPKLQPQRIKMHLGYALKLMAINLNDFCSRERAKHWIDQSLLSHAGEFIE
jgi:hypothetical protein